LRATRALINLSRLLGNYRSLKAYLGEAVSIMPVIKADAYGHGAVAVARTLSAEGARFLAVAILEEALELREAGVKERIVLLSPFYPEEAGMILDYRITPLISDFFRAEILNLEAARRNVRSPIHIKVDTGMGRLGIPQERALEEIKRIAGLPHIEIEGICTHFPSADEKDLAFTKTQIENFERLVRSLQKDGIDIPIKHTANSGAILSLKSSHFNMVRPGIMLYGLYPSPECPRTVDVKPVMKVVSRVALIKKVPPGTPVSYGRTFITKRESTLIVLPIGYADGFPRSLSNKGRVKIGDKFLPLAGRVCMDQIIVDATEVGGLEVGSEAVVFSDVRDDVNSVESVARILGTIPNEIVTGISKRVPRLFVRDS